jgi:DNA-binding IclR family transcriptional regulator
MTEHARPPQASLTTLKVLRLLEKHFAYGLANKDIAEGAGISQSQAIHHVAALIEAGYAERIPETGRLRPSVRYAQAAVTIMREVDRAAGRFTEIQSRFHTL